MKSGKIIALTSAFLVILGSLLSWGVSVSPTTTEPIYGFQGDGKITIFFAIIAIILLFLRKSSHYVAFTLGLIITIVGLIDYTQVHDILINYEGYVGFGLYLTILAGFGISVGTIIEIIARKRAHLA